MAKQSAKSFIAAVVISLIVGISIGMASDANLFQGNVRGKKNVTSESGKIIQNKTSKRNKVLGTGTPPDGNLVIETYIGSCNDPFGSPTCVVPGQYTTEDLAYGSDQLVYTMRLTNTSPTITMQVDKVFLEYDTFGLDTSVWGRTSWNIFDGLLSGPTTRLTYGRLVTSPASNGYVDFDWAYPGNSTNPINQPPSISPGGSQFYTVTVDVADDFFGPTNSDYIQVRANDSFPFTPVIGGTLAQARSVNAHFIWHDTATNLYYTEEHTSLMDMWGGVSNAYAQWRKRQYDPLTRYELLNLLFTIKGQPLSSAGAICPDTTSGQNAAMNTGIELGIFTPYPTGYCGPNETVLRAQASKFLYNYADFVTNSITLYSPSVSTFPDVPVGVWYFDFVESLYNAMGSVYATAGSNFNPAWLLDESTATTWITNLP